MNNGDWDDSFELLVGFIILVTWLLLLIGEGIYG
jgi:hypothetical protein